MLLVTSDKDLSKLLDTPTRQFALYERLAVLGTFRGPVNAPANASDGDVHFRDAGFCEDLHHHARSKSLFTSCDEGFASRVAWFPGLMHYNDPVQALKAKGSIHVIDTETMSSRQLQFTNFDGPFITHGIDIIDDPEDSEAIYIMAVNHRPSREYLTSQAASGRGAAPLLDARIEVFHHIIGSNEARHVRSVSHPLLTLPNDVLATSPTSFHVTIDHYYTYGIMRLIEDLFPRARWSYILHVDCSGVAAALPEADTECTATVALTGIQNNNGLGHGRTPDEILIGCAVSGRMYVGRLKELGGSIEIVDMVQYPANIDNPSYFHDPYANSTFDASGVLNVGLYKALTLPQTSADPEGKEGSMAWLLRPNSSTGSLLGSSLSSWETGLLFEDEGDRMRFASGGALVAIDPAKEAGQRKAWLFMAGALAPSVFAVKVDL
ncbi:serum paraoxonase/arylesterase family protein [Stachybotrys elegans]|uniref:Serum paraoxonase/arylesterase family protein n=1 Tax=Stachybotrys elegans TaxID=80388 RepID=A0A8K0SYL0_9HYPO|nr:serum paraoxonase/arylesterase family protein [Stachybotrys elegans]